MPVRIGSTILQIAKKSHICEKCEQPIPAGSLYNIKSGQKGKLYFSHKFHSQCWEEDYQLLKKSLLETHRKISEHTPGIRKTPLKKLTAEQITRRKSLMIYHVQRDIPSLIKAYEQQSTKRLYRTMGLIADRWEELHSMGVPFRNTLTTRADNENNKKVTKYVLKWDSHWFFDRFGFEGVTVEQQIAALRRDESDNFPPSWVDSGDTLRDNVSVEVEDDPGEEHNGPD